MLCWKLTVSHHDRVWHWEDDGDGIAYHVESGDTHLLSALAVELLLLLESGPKVTSVLVGELQDAFANSPERNAEPMINQALVSLESIGLVSRSSS